MPDKPMAKRQKSRPGLSRACARVLLHFTLALALSVGSAFAQEIAGRASVIDGDTLEIRGERIRLFGIDAPETGQSCEDAAGNAYRCGQRAALFLADMLGSKLVRCVERDRDRYRRIVGECYSSDGTNVSAAMVVAGHALAFRRYSREFVADEDTARLARRGIWVGRFDAPWEWRRNRR